MILSENKKCAGFREQKRYVLILITFSKKSKQIRLSSIELTIKSNEIDKKNLRTPIDRLL